MFEMDSSLGCTLECPFHFHFPRMHTWAPFSLWIFVATSWFVGTILKRIELSGRDTIFNGPTDHPLLDAQSQCESISWNSNCPGGEISLFSFTYIIHQDIFHQYISPLYFLDILFCCRVMTLWSSVETRAGWGETFTGAGRGGCHCLKLPPWWTSLIWLFLQSFLSFKFFIMSALASNCNHDGGYKLAIKLSHLTLSSVFSSLKIFMIWPLPQTATMVGNMKFFLQSSASFFSHFYLWKHFVMWPLPNTWRVVGFNYFQSLCLNFFDDKTKHPLE